MIHPRSAALVFLALAAAPHAQEQGEDAPLLRSGEPFAGTLDLAPDSEAVAEHRIVVPEDAVALSVELVCGRADLDLRVVLEKEDEEEQDDAPEWTASTEFGREELSVNRFSDPPLAPGTYVVEAVYPWNEPPIWRDQRLQRVPYRLTASVVRTREDGTLHPGEAKSAELDDASGRFRTYRIEVPPDAPALRVDISRAAGDVDLYLERGHPILRADGADFFASQGYGRETLVVTRESRPPLRPGTWFLDVVDPLDEGSAPSSFTVHVQFDEHPPAELLPLPPFPPVDEQDTLARALQCVVEIFVPEGAGSGCLIDASGRVLTCAHVVSDLALDPLEEVVIGVTLDPRQPSVELFRARVVQFDRERDLAIAQIVSGLYGQPLPDGYRFPALERGEPGSLHIGDALWIVGYPGTGGSKSRVSITATRGILAGFEASVHGTLFKTDAKVHEGHSGGAALDARGRLVGLPSFITYSGESELGYLIPVDAVPEGW